MYFIRATRVPRFYFVAPLTIVYLQNAASILLVHPRIWINTEEACVFSRRIIVHIADKVDICRDVSREIN